MLSLEDFAELRSKLESVEMQAPGGHVQASLEHDGHSPDCSGVHSLPGSWSRCEHQEFCGQNVYTKQRLGRGKKEAKHPECLAGRSASGSFLIFYQCMALFLLSRARTTTRICEMQVALTSPTMPQASSMGWVGRSTRCQGRRT